MIYLILALFGQGLDCISTEYCRSFGGVEANPLMRPIVPHPILFYTIKLMIPVFIYAITKKGSKERKTYLLFTFAVGAFAGIHNFWITL